jgi:hypothetical protein
MLVYVPILVTIVGEWQGPEDRAETSNSHRVETLERVLGLTYRKR